MWKTLLVLWRKRKRQRESFSSEHIYENGYPKPPTQLRVRVRRFLLWLSLGSLNLPLEPSCHLLPVRVRDVLIAGHAKGELEILVDCGVRLVRRLMQALDVLLQLVLVRGRQRLRAEPFQDLGDEVGYRLQTFQARLHGATPLIDIHAPLDESGHL